MPELIDCEWFYNHTSSANTVDKIKLIADYQKKALKDNFMPISDEEYSLELDGTQIFVEKSSAVNALEIYQEIFRDRDHEKVPEFSLFGKKRIIDLGANYGFYALSVKRQAPECKVLCLEPNKYIFPLLKKNLKEYTDISLINGAIGIEDKVDDFEVVRQIPSIGGVTLRQVERKWLAEDLIEKYTVNFISLTSIYKDYEIENCDILKVDVEGVEAEIFDSTPAEVLLKSKRIVVERHTEEIHKRVINRLCEVGFKLVYDLDPDCQKHYGNLYFSQ